MAIKIVLVIDQGSAGRFANKVNFSQYLLSYDEEILFRPTIEGPHVDFLQKCKLFWCLGGILFNSRSILINSGGLFPNPTLTMQFLITTLKFFGSLYRNIFEDIWFLFNY